MMYSDTKVIYTLGKYVITTVLDGNTTMTAANMTSIVANFSISNHTDRPDSSLADSSDMWMILLGMLFVLVCIYLISLVGMFFSPIFSRLSTSYNTGLLMANVSDEMSHSPIPLSKTINYNLQML